jgi:hypothetical protein
VRLADRTHAGRVGKQSLTARAVSPLAHVRAQRPSSHLAARDSQLAGPRRRRPNPAGSGFLAWSRCRTTSAGRLTRKLGVARRKVRRRAGRCPHHSPSLGRLKNVGVFLTGGSPSPALDRLGPVRLRVLRPERTCIAPDALRAFGGRDQSNFGAHAVRSARLRTLRCSISSLLGRADGARTLPGRASWLGRAAARLRLDASPASWESRAPAGRRRAGRCPHHSPSLGRLKNVGVFLTGGSPSPALDRLGPVRLRVLRPERTCIAPDARRTSGGRDQAEFGCFTMACQTCIT